MFENSTELHSTTGRSAMHGTVSLRHDVDTALSRTEHVMFDMQTRCALEIKMLEFRVCYDCEVCSL